MIYPNNYTNRVIAIHNVDDERRSCWQYWDDTPDVVGCDSSVIDDSWVLMMTVSSITTVVLLH